MCWEDRQARIRPANEHPENVARLRTAIFGMEVKRGFVSMVAVANDERGGKALGELRGLAIPESPQPAS